MATAPRKAALHDWTAERCLADFEGFALALAHDLRSPLGAVSALTTVLLEDEGRLSDADRKGLGARVRRSLAAATAGLAALDAYARASRGELRPERLDMTALVRGAWNEVASYRQAPPPPLAIGPLPDATGDALLLRAALVKLFEHALARPRCSGEPLALEVSGAVSGTDCEYVLADPGALPEPARRDDGTVRAALALASRVLRSHGGRFRIERSPTTAAVFHFSLPREGA